MVTRLRPCMKSSTPPPFTRDRETANGRVQRSGGAPVAADYRASFYCSPRPSPPPRQQKSRYFFMPRPFQPRPPPDGTNLARVEQKQKMTTHTPLLENLSHATKFPAINSSYQKQRLRLYVPSPSRGGVGFCRCPQALMLGYRCRASRLHSAGCRAA